MTGMHRGLALVLLLVAPLFGQAQNDSQLRFTVNDTSGAGPATVQIARPDTAVLSIETLSPGTPFLLAVAPGLSVGSQTIGSVQVDIGPAASLILNGFNPTTFLDTLASTDASGTASFSFPIGSQQPLGTLAALQVFAVDFTVPGNVSDSAARVLEIIDRVGHGTAHFVAGPSESMLQGIYASTPATGTTATAVPSSDFELVDIETDDGPGWGGPDHLRRDLDASAIKRAFSAERQNGPFFIRTRHGDVYGFRDNTPAIPEFGFALVPAAGGSMLELPGTRIPALNAAGAVPYGFNNVAVSPDQNVLVAMAQNNGRKIITARLDGGVFPATGIDSASIPVNASFANANVRGAGIAGSRVFFPTGVSTSPLAYTSLDGTTAVTLLTVPPLGTGATAQISANRYYTSPFLPTPQGDGLYFRASDPTTSILVFGTARPADVMYIDASAAAPTVSNLSAFSSPLDVTDWSVSHFQDDPYRDVSPDGSRCCFATGLTDVSTELWIVDRNSPGNPVPLTDTNLFDTPLSLVHSPVFRTNDDVIAVVGDLQGRSDVYEISAPGLVPTSVTNLTNTSGQSGAALPITYAPFAKLTPTHFTREGDRIFCRNSPGYSNDIYMIDVPTSAVHVLNGSVPAPGGSPVTPPYALWESTTTRLAPDGDGLWLKGISTATGTVPNDVFHVDLTAPGPAVRVTDSAVDGMYRVDDITPSPDGTAALLYVIGGTAVNGPKELRLVTTTSTNAAPVATGLPPNFEATIGSMRWFDLGNPNFGVVGVFEDITFSISRTVIQAIDLVTTNTSTLPAPAGYKRLLSVN